MTLRHCDICGSVVSADQYEPGRGVFAVAKAVPARNPFEELMAQMQPQHEQYDFCAECSQHLVRLITERRIAK